MLRRLPFVLPRPGVLMVTTVALLGFAATYLLAPLNGNLRYEAGVKLVSPVSAADTFSYRPLAFRVLMDGVFRLSRDLSFGFASFELVVRALVGLAAVGAGMLLWRGLLARGVRQPGLHAVVAVGAVLATGPVSAGEPEWMASILAIAGAGAALIGRCRPWWWSGLAGALFVAAAGMKVITLVPALVALGVVGLMDRRQLGRTMTCCLVVGSLYMLGTLLWVPDEVQWLLDIRTVQTDWVAELSKAGPWIRHLATDRPVLLLLPAALMLAPPRERAATLLAVGATAAAVVLQGQYFAYHSVPLLVVASVATFRGLRSRTSTAVGLGVLAVVLAATTATATRLGSSDLRVSHGPWWGVTLLGTAVAALGWACTLRHRPHSEPGGAPLLAGLATLALLYPGSTPWAAQLLPFVDAPGRPLTTLEGRSQHEAVARQVHRIVGGPTVPVTYLTFGDWTYFIRNPTDCRYPSPLFLQRTRYTDRVVGRPSYQENLACLAAPDSRWLVWDPAWFPLKRTALQVRTALTETWDCSVNIEVGGLRLCPRRR